MKVRMLRPVEQGEKAPISRFADLIEFAGIVLFFSLHGYIIIFVFIVTLAFFAQKESPLR